MVIQVRTDFFKIKNPFVKFSLLCMSVVTLPWADLICKQMLIFWLELKTCRTTMPFPLHHRPLPPPSCSYQPPYLLDTSLLTNISACLYSLRTTGLGARTETSLALNVAGMYGPEVESHPKSKGHISGSCALGHNDQNPLHLWTYTIWSLFQSPFSDLSVFFHGWLLTVFEILSSLGQPSRLPLSCFIVKPLLIHVALT